MVLLGSLAQMRLQFAEGRFDRVEIWRIGRQIKQVRTYSGAVANVVGTCLAESPVR